jgi:hypothetical protein
MELKVDYSLTQLRNCATSRKVAGSILDGVIGIFHLLNLSGLTVDLISTHLQQKTVTAVAPWVKVAGV